MSNWPITPASRFEYIGATTGGGTTLTGGAANVKGSYATIGTAGFAWSQFLLSFVNTGSNSRFRVDIAINTGGSDQIIVEDLFVDLSISQSQPVVVPIPVAVPAGATVKARFQAELSGRTLGVILCGFAQGFMGAPGGARLRSFTDWTNTNPTNSVSQNGQSWTAWTQIMATTPERAAALYFSNSEAGDNSRTSCLYLIEIAKGASGSEVAIGAFVGRQLTAGWGGIIGCIPCDLPAGERLSFRCQCDTAGIADSIAVACNGLVP